MVGKPALASAMKSGQGCSNVCAKVRLHLYLFRRIEQRLDGSPTLVLLDEAWSYLHHELF
jgi:hypothetical protein